jgi:hypothetical protein
VRCSRGASIVDCGRGFDEGVRESMVVVTMRGRWTIKRKRKEREKDGEEGGGGGG